MLKAIKISFLFFLLMGLMNPIFADRGLGKKKTKILVKIPVTDMGNSKISFNLRTGLTYKGSLIENDRNDASGEVTTKTLVTYKQGNNVYILPYKQKVVQPESGKGYAGLKLIIHRSN
ncbi:MAG TPA: hypothetical protein PKD97_08670 [Ferruginibacter sp.]|nr:hypothetical protein [Ferruginibacter sp.]